MKAIEIFDRAYLVDDETMNVLHKVMPAAALSGDRSAVMSVLVLGLATGRIKEDLDDDGFTEVAWREREAGVQAANQPLIY